MPAWRKIEPEKKRKGNCPSEFRNWDEFWLQYQGIGSGEFRRQWRCETCGLLCSQMNSTNVAHTYDSHDGLAITYGGDPEAVIYCNQGGGDRYLPSRFVRVT